MSVPLRSIRLPLVYQYRRFPKPFTAGKYDLSFCAMHPKLSGKGQIPSVPVKQ